jgi:hypothetical protein
MRWASESKPADHRKEYGVETIGSKLGLSYHLKLVGSIFVEFLHHLNWPENLDQSSLGLEHRVKAATCQQS